MPEPPSDPWLTIWIPTYRRRAPLQALLANLQAYGLSQMARIVVSDNDPGGALQQAVASGSSPLPVGVAYRCNPANLSAGVNFLRAFEACTTPWLMIVGDDDLFAADAVTSLQDLVRGLPDSVLGVKFDSTLFGRQMLARTGDLEGYLQTLKPRDYAAAFNNLCLISNWLLRVPAYRCQLATAFLGYSSKLSHLFPLLKACQQGGELLFSPLQPVIHGSSDDSSWPKAATWFEMTLTLSSFSGFVDPGNRRALLRLLLHSDWRRYIAKCLRTQQFYGASPRDVSPWMIHAQLALVSGGYRWALLFCLPLLLIPFQRLPRRLRQKLGDPGRVDRW